MDKSKFKPYIAFIFLCIAYGTSSALVSIIRKTVDPIVLSCVRFFFGLVTSIFVFTINIIKDNNYMRHIRQSLSSQSINVPKAMLCGIINYGFPYSLIAISQRSVSSIAVQISQPLVSVFSLLASHILLSNEKCTAKKLFYQLLSVFGTILTSIPTLKFSESKNAVFMFDYFLLFLSTVSFGFGTVYVKYSQSKPDQTALCMFQLLGAFIYSFVYGVYCFGLNQFIFYLAQIDRSALFLIIILGIFYTCLTSITFLYVLRELGVVVSNYTNVGQIIIGILVGVVFLNEWSNYSIFDIVLSITGLIVLFVSIIFGIQNENKINSNDELTPFVQNL